MSDEEFKARIEESLRGAITEFFEADNDPEDTLFLTLTQRDYALVRVALLITAGTFNWSATAVASLANKLADAIEAQKGGDV